VFGLEQTVEGVSAKYTPRGREVSLFGGRVTRSTSGGDQPGTNPVSQPRGCLVAGGSVKESITTT